jgi:hypothetical protein
MGFFKSIKKAFKKVTSGIKKAVKGVVKGVKKVVKKISSSKILKALAIAAAVVVTGGAAIAAFTGGAGIAGASSFATFGNWMMGTSQLVTGGTLFGTSTALARGAGTAAKFIASPFKAVGTALGTAAGAVTDFTGLTTEASRTGLSTQELSYFNEGDILAQEGSVAAKDASSFAETVVNPSTGIETAKTGFFDTTAGKVVSNVGTAVGTNVLTGAAMQYIQGDPEQQGSMGGLRTEGATQFDPLRVYAAERGIADTDISKYFTFGNTASAGNMPLFQQQTIGVPS